MIRNRLIEPKRTNYFNRGMLSDAVLFFTFSLMAFGLEDKTIVLSSRELFTIPDWVYTFYGTLAALLSAILLIAAFSKRLADITSKLIDGPSGFVYWTYFFCVYVLTWIKGLTLTHQDKFTFYLVAYLGIVWFIIIAVIWLSRIYKFIRWLREFPHVEVVK